MVVEIREAVLPDDRAQIRGLWREYLGWGNDELEARYGFRLAVEPVVDHDLDDIAKFMPPDGRILLAVEGATAFGIACARRIGPATAEIKRMYVEPAHRRDGVGAALLGRLIALCRAAGYERIRLDSAAFMTAAHALYRKAGFASIPPYPESEIPDEHKDRWLFMELALDRAPGT